MSAAPPRVLTLPAGEPILHHGPDDGPQLLVLQPLFEEMNRCRALVAALCRGLTARGIGCWLPDLPGTGESVRALETTGWDDWGATIDAALAIAGATATVAIRGGALLDGPAARRWRLSPVPGASLATDLRRSGLIASGAYALGDDLATRLAAAAPRGAARTIRLDGDDRACDRLVAGSTLWRRPEPTDDPALAALLVADIAGWIGA